MPPLREGLISRGLDFHGLVFQLIFMLSLKCQNGLILTKYVDGVLPLNDTSHPIMGPITHSVMHLLSLFINVTQRVLTCTPARSASAPCCCGSI